MTSGGGFCEGTAPSSPADVRAGRACRAIRVVTRGRWNVKMDESGSTVVALHLRTPWSRSRRYARLVQCTLVLRGRTCLHFHCHSNGCWCRFAFSFKLTVRLRRQLNFKKAPF